MPNLRRRDLIGTTLVLLTVACGRPVAERPTPAEPVLGPEFDRWNQEARGILSDSLGTLRTFDTFHAFRVATASQSGMRQAAELAWDPPTAADWDEATHVTRGLYGRADQLVQAITTANIDPNLWRQQRAVADMAHDLLDLGEALAAYRERLDVLPPGDASAALGLLDKAWSQWEAVAGRWSVSRAELLPCGAT